MPFEFKASSASSKMAERRAEIRDKASGGKMHREMEARKAEIHDKASGGQMKRDMAEQRAKIQDKASGGQMKRDMAEQRRDIHEKASGQNIQDSMAVQRAEIKAACKGGTLESRQFLHEDQLTPWQKQNREKLYYDASAGGLVIKQKWELTEADHAAQRHWDALAPSVETGGGDVCVSDNTGASSSSGLSHLSFLRANQKDLKKTKKCSTKSKKCQKPKSAQKGAITASPQATPWKAGVQVAGGQTAMELEEWLQRAYFATSADPVSPLRPSLLERVLHQYGFIVHLALYPVTCALCFLECIIACPIVGVLIPFLNPLMTFFLIPDLLRLLLKPCCSAVHEWLPGNTSAALVACSRWCPFFGIRFAYAFLGASIPFKDLAKRGDNPDCLFADIVFAATLDEINLKQYCCPRRTARRMAEYVRILPVSPLENFSDDLEGFTSVADLPEYASVGVCRAFHRRDATSALMLLQAIASWGADGAIALHAAAEREDELRSWIVELVSSGTVSDRSLCSYLQHFVGMDPPSVASAQGSEEGVELELV
eukprot:TRINITY_DN8236_c0_g1_i1.p1 TRINITY_DN8236_c0_g1~~TRINITY_DN8236_c0_g1_i1.p1  ORF type:complete len:541 (-),score=83.33 TRINITY_DN8236_c0_g1_i1:373-1995(-)